MKTTPIISNDVQLAIDHADNIKELSEIKRVVSNTRDFLVWLQEDKGIEVEELFKEFYETQ